MSPPKGNQFWLQRSSHGRNPKFGSPDDLWHAAQEYFQWVEDNPLKKVELTTYQGHSKLEEVPLMRAMTIEGLCIFIDIGRTTWDRYCEQDDFRDITTRIADIIRDQKFTGASAGLLNANIIARDLGLADKSEQTGNLTVNVNYGCDD